MERHGPLQLACTLALLLGAGSAHSALVTVTADQSQISVGETLTLSVEGLINPSF